MPGIWRVRRGVIRLIRPLVMGIVNTTPDSFSDGGRFLAADAAIAHARALVDAGADIVDVGGESTRPGADPVPADEEIRRTLPVVEALAADGVIVSIDTRKPRVAEAAVHAGAEIVNDIGGLRDPSMREVVARSGAGAVVMHMQGDPRTMQEDPRYDDVVTDVLAALRACCAAAVEAGIADDALAVDPGIGFGKHVEHNLALLHRLSEFTALGRPLVLGTSRKRFLGALSGHDDPEDRDFATAVTVAMAVERGAAVVRVHDVARAVESARIAWAIVREQRDPWVPIQVEGAAGG